MEGLNACVPRTEAGNAMSEIATEEKFENDEKPGSSTAIKGSPNMSPTRFSEISKSTRNLRKTSQFLAYLLTTVSAKHRLLGVVAAAGHRVRASLHRKHFFLFTMVRASLLLARVLHRPALFPYLRHSASA